MAKLNGVASSVLLTRGASGFPQYSSDKSLVKYFCGNFSIVDIVLPRTIKTAIKRK